MMVVFWWFIHLLGTFPVVGGDELGGGSKVLFFERSMTSA